MAVINGRIEGESMPMHSGSRVQDMRKFGPQWSGGAHLLWAGEVGQSMDTKFRVERAGRYSLSVRMTTAIDYGVFTISINGKELKREVDLFSQRVALMGEIDLGELQLEAGEQKLTCKLTGSTRARKSLARTNFCWGWTI